MGVSSGDATQDTADATLVETDDPDFEGTVSRRELLGLRRMAEQNQRLSDDLRAATVQLQATESLLRRDVYERGREALVGGASNGSADHDKLGLAGRDRLTGLYNRRMLEQRLQEEV